MMFCPLLKADCRTDCMLFSTLDGECKIALMASCTPGENRYIHDIDTQLRRLYRKDYRDHHVSWHDGSIVIPGQVAMSLRGPRRIISVEFDESGWRLIDEDSYIIDEGSFDAHPTRMGEPCDFYPEAGDEVSAND